MVSPVSNNSQSVFSNQLVAKKKKAILNHKDLIIEMENSRKPKVACNFIKEDAETQKNVFVEKASLYTSVNLLHYLCNQKDDEKNDSKSIDTDTKFILIVKELTQEKNIGFWRINSEMKKHFPNLSTWKMVFYYYGFIGWLPNLYIQMTLDKITSFLKTSLKEGENLPKLGSNIFGTLNTYLANYNRTIDRFTNDSSTPTGDRDTYVRNELAREEILGYKSIDKLYKDFALAASKEDMRPAFRTFSSFCKKNYNIRL